jgi:hypothetical protein
VASTLETIQPYVEQLFEDSDVQKQLRRAAANLRGATSRAGRAKSAKKAAKDPVLRQRIVEGARAAVAAGVAVKRAPEKQQRRSRRGRLLLLGGLVAAGVVATNEQARGRLLGLLGGNPDQEPAST